MQLLYKHPETKTFQWSIVTKLHFGGSESQEG
jgi:hypothetical protein